MMSRAITRREAIAAGLVSAAALWSWRTTNADAAGSAVVNGASTSTGRFTAQLGTPQSQPGLLMLGMTGSAPVSTSNASLATQSVNKMSKPRSTAKDPASQQSAAVPTRSSGKPVRTRRRRHRRPGDHLRSKRHGHRRSSRGQRRVSQSSRRAS